MDTEDVLEADFHDARVKVYVADLVLLFKRLEHLNEKVDLLTKAMFAKQIDYLQRFVNNLVQLNLRLRNRSCNPAHLVHPAISK